MRNHCVELPEIIWKKRGGKTLHDIHKKVLIKVHIKKRKQ